MDLERICGLLEAATSTEGDEATTLQPKRDADVDVTAHHLALLVHEVVEIHVGADLARTMPRHQG